MRMRTPVNSSSKSKHWKASPPTGKDIPLQQCRPIMRLQQAREPVLELFEPSPVQLRYEEADQSPFKLEVRPKYPSQYPRKLLDAYSTEPTHEPKQNRAITQRPFTMFGLFSFMVLAVASLHLINFGNHSFEGIRFNSGRNGKNIFLSDKSSFIRSNHRNLVRGLPRTFFMGERADDESPSFQPAPGRTVILYPSEFSDVTQFYDTKSSDDSAIADSIERKFFPMHETNADCVPMSGWQTKSFREYWIWPEMRMSLHLSHI